MVYVQVSKAYAVLSDPQKRKYYDDTGDTEELDVRPEEFVGMFQDMMKDMLGGMSINDMVTPYLPPIYHLSTPYLPQLKSSKTENSWSQLGMTSTATNWNLACYRMIVFRTPKSQRVDPIGWNSVFSTWVVDSQFARIRKLNGFARIRPGYARLLDIVRIALLLTASPADRIRNSH